MRAFETSASRLPGLPARYFFALRPPFLLLALASCLVGIATAFASGVPIDAAKAIVTIVFAMAAQGAANVINDYYDSMGGGDAAGTERLLPFTGGSRMIRHGVLTERQMLSFGTLLFGATMAGGLWLMAVSGPELLFVGAAGVFIGWAYSAPPFNLNRRGWGEPCTWAAWMLIAAAADYVQRGEPSALPWIASSGYALLVTNILFVSRFPERRADELAGKRHWVVRLGARRAADVYSVMGVGANVFLVAGALSGALPPTALAALLAVPLTARAAYSLQRHHGEAARLAPALQASIAAALAHAALLSAGLAATRWA